MDLASLANSASKGKDLETSIADHRGTCCRGPNRPSGAPHRRRRAFRRTLAQGPVPQSKAADERHWHKDGTAERGGPCLTIDGKTRYFGSNALCAVERAAIIVARQAGGSVSGDTAQALVHCVQGLGPPLTAACQGKLEWLVDGNGRFGSSVPTRPI